MSETRSHISEGNVLHIAVVSSRAATSLTKRSVWRRAGIAALLVLVIIGAWDIISRMASLLDTAHAQTAAGGLYAVQEMQPLDAIRAHIAETGQSPVRMVPARLRIPAIGVDASVQPVGVSTEGAMQAPGNFRDVGWYRYGVMPGGEGSAVFDGHVNNALTKTGVFQQLNMLREGDAVIIADANGYLLTFLVTMARSYDTNEAPTAEIFSRAGDPRIALITCDGQWDSAARQYTKRLVVYAQLSH